MIVLKYICLLIAIMFTFILINYKVSMFMKMLCYKEEEEISMAKWSFIWMIIASFAWTTYLVCF